MISGFLLAGLAALFASSFMSTGPHVDDEDDPETEPPDPEDKDDTPDLFAGQDGGVPGEAGAAGPEHPLDLPEWEAESVPVWFEGGGSGAHTDVTATSGVQVLEGFQPGTDSVSVHLESWETEISQLIGGPEGPALSFGDSQDATVLKFPGLDDVPSDDINLVVGDNGGPLVTVRLSDAIVPDDDAVLHPLDPDADEDYAGDTHLPAVQPESPDAPETYPDEPSGIDGLAPVPADDDGAFPLARDAAAPQTDPIPTADEWIPDSDDWSAPMVASEIVEPSPGEGAVDELAHERPSESPVQSLEASEILEPKPLDGSGDWVSPALKGQLGHDGSDALPATGSLIAGEGSAPPQQDPGLNAKPETPEDSGLAGEPNTQVDLAPASLVPPADQASPSVDHAPEPQTAETAPSPDPALSTKSGESGSSGNPAPDTGSESHGGAEMAAPVSPPADQIELAVRKNGPAADIFDFDPGRDVLKITVENGPGKGNAVSVVKSANGQDSHVLVGKQVVAVLRGAPGVMLSDLVVRYSPGK